MATLLNANLPSDDEEDDDYDPTKDKTGSDDEKKKAAKAATGRIGVRHRGAVAGRGGGLAEKRGREEEEEEDETAAPQEPVALTSSQIAKKAKVDDIWASLKQRTSAGSSSKPQATAGAIPSRPPQPAPAGKLLGPQAAKLQPGGSVPATPATTPQGKAAADLKPKTSLTSIAAAALAAAKAATSVKAAQQHGMVAVVETRKFAGKDIQLTKNVSSTEAAAAAAAAKKKAGLDAVLESLQSAKKVNILDKTRHDWSGYKKANTDMEEELENHQRSGGKYLDKVDFLKRAELREYEQDRDKRLASSMNTRGRL